MIILCFVNGLYEQIARNWLCAIGRLELLESVLLVTLDEAAEAAFGPHAVKTLHRPIASAGVRDIWLHRARIVAEFLRQGKDVVHSDADAVWLGNPLPYLFGEADDAVFSQGTVWPPESFARRRFVLCCGLYGIRSNPLTIAFMDALLPAIEKYGDDQKALNYLVDERLGDWQLGQTYELEFRNRQLLCSREKMRAQQGGMTLSVLPHHLFPRLMTSASGVVVGHPLSAKTAEETERVLRDTGLWLLS